jgi:hypothetical protein
VKTLAPLPPILLAAVFLVVFFFVMNYRRKKNLELLEHVALRRGGSVSRGFLLGFGKLVVPCGSHEISVHSKPGSKHSPPKTKVSCPLAAGRDLAMSLASENIFQKASKLVGAQDIEVGNDAFDRAFMVKGSDESAVKALLTPTVQERLMSLSGEGLSLSLTRDELNLVVNTIPSSEMEYDRIMDAFQCLLDVVRGESY